MGYEFIPVNALDWGIIIGFLVFTLVVGIMKLVYLYRTAKIFRDYSPENLQ